MELYFQVSGISLVCGMGLACAAKIIRYLFVTSTRILANDKIFD